MSVRILVGDVRERLRELPDGLVRCCVTSPPYFGLRDYGHDGQIGLEPTPDAYVSELVAVFREVRRVLSDDGTLWLNLGDSYAAGRGGTAMPAETLAGGENGKGDNSAHRGRLAQVPNGKNPNAPIATCQPHRNAAGIGLKHKDMIGIPWRVAFALQADGWYLRSDIIWAKPNPMPESVTDRPTKSHEYLFLLSKKERYFYDAAAIAEESLHAGAVVTNNNGKNGQDGRVRPDAGGFLEPEGVTVAATRNARTVWTITTRPFKEAHFATFPPELPERCIRAGSAKDDIVLDPFGGAGTTGLVADRLGRNAVLCELNPEYAKMAERRIRGDNPMFADVEAA